MKRPTKTTRRSVSIFAQIVHQLPGHLVEHLAAKQTVKARELSYSTQLHLLMLGQLLHAFSLNELVDISQVHCKELKQTLQLQSFYGTNEKAVQWQIWAALIVHLVLRYLAFKSRWCGSYSRFVGLIRTAIWMKTDLETLLVFYGIAPPRKTHKMRIRAPYLPGFEKAYLDAVGQQSP